MLFRKFRSRFETGRGHSKVPAVLVQQQVGASSFALCCGNGTHWHITQLGVPVAYFIFTGSRNGCFQQPPLFLLLWCRRLCLYFFLCVALARWSLHAGGVEHAQVVSVCLLPMNSCFCGRYMVATRKAQQQHCPDPTLVYFCRQQCGAVLSPTDHHTNGRQ